MSLSSLLYIGCLIVFVAIYWLIPEKFRTVWILLASVAFCVYSMPKQMLALVLYVLAIYVIGLFAKEGGKLWVAVTVGISVVFLFIYKFEPISLVAPIGISYVTFQCIAYIVDIYRGKMPAEKDVISFFTYNLFFAKLTAGPIERPAEFMAQLRSPKVLSWKRCSRGVLLILMGFVKKIAVADVLGAGVNAVYGAAATSTGWETILASFMYAVQILFDFSGYTDIARGSAMLMGFELTENFDSPYMAVSFRDFWRRWHISLSTWLRDYVYIPLGGSRVVEWRRCFNIVVTFVVSGLWHGIGWTFLVWGLLHGLLQAGGILIENSGKKVRAALRINDKVYAWFMRVRTFLLVTFAWVFFRAASLGDAINILWAPFRGMGSLGAAFGTLGLSAGTIILVIAGIVSTTLISRLLKNPVGRDTVIFICILTVIVVALVFTTTFGTASPFIYFDF